MYLASVFTSLNTELTRGCWPKKYTSRYMSIAMQNCWVCMQQKNMQCVPKATEIYMVAYTLAFCFRAVVQFWSKTHSLIITILYPLVRCTEQFWCREALNSLCREWTQKLCPAHMKRAPASSTWESKPAGGFGRFKPLAWWEEPVQGIKLKVAWSANLWSVYNKHTDFQN